MLKLTHILLTILLTLVAVACTDHTQRTSDAEWHTGHVGTREGLTNGKIMAMEQDGDGFVWVGTSNGLFHLTGDRAVKIDAQQLGLSSAYIGSICYDSLTHSLWVSTMQAGVSVYDCRRRTFTPMTSADGLISDMVPCVTRAAGGGVWLVYHNGEVQRWQGGRLTTLSAAPLPDVVRSAIDDGKGRLLVCLRNNTVSGISTLDGTVRHNIPVQLPHSAYSKQVRSLSVDSTGAIVGDYRIPAPLTDSHGNVWYKRDGLGVEVAYRNPPMFRIGRAIVSQGAHTMTTAMAQDPDGHIWVGTAGGLLCCDSQGTVRRRVDMRHMLSADTVYISAMTMDAHGNILMGIDDHFIVSYNPADNALTHYKSGRGKLYVYAFHRMADGSIAAATERGLWLREGDGDFVEFAGNGNMTSKIANDVVADKNGNMWVSTIGGGLNLTDRTGRLLDAVTRDRGLPSDNVRQTLIDPESGEAWVATDNGIAHIFNIQSPDSMEVLDRQQGLADNDVVGLRADGYGQIWVATQSGISAWDADRHIFINYNHDDGAPEGFYKINTSLLLADGRVCFGSHSGMAVIAPVEGKGQRDHVESFAFRNPTPWWRTYTALAAYVVALLLVGILIIRRMLTATRLKVEKGERVLQQAAPIDVLSAQDKEFLDKVTAYIEQNLGSEKLDVVSVAQEMAMSHSVFYRRIKAITGLTAAEYTRKIKLRCARKMLEEGHCTVQQVSAAVGFRHLASFREAFKKEFDMLPSEVQKSK